MTFLFGWKHNDGSIVEFSEKGWRSDDAGKGDWLLKMSELHSRSPVLAPPIRIWLQQNCQLVEVTGPKDAVTPTIRIPYDSRIEISKLEALARARSCLTR
jgi:hypothetical protein